uniref:Uncharacterized protein n=1 Tax=Tanacetum cinerariifolium TaxID=118510 RepID=A0A6L2LLG3_TANCI|nr:hypothetical protein [Tanacetum cinerariifolium]
MAQPQRQADVHQDELCPPNKRYALMNTNKKIDLDNLLKELTMTLDDFRTIFQLPQATNNNHERFVAGLKFLEMVPLFLNDLGFTLKITIPLQKNWSHTIVADTLQDVFMMSYNTRRNKAGVEMKIPRWMITDEMKFTENYQMYAEVFRVDVPTTQSQPIESTHGMLEI